MYINANNNTDEIQYAVPTRVGEFTLNTENCPIASTIEDNGQFRDNKELTTIDIPNVTSIGYRAFSSCSSLTTIDTPNVTNIGSSAFSSCTSLTTIDIPNVTNIGSSAFYNCTNLTAIHFSATNKSKIEANSYYSSKWGATNATIYFDL